MSLDTYCLVGSESLPAEERQHSRLPVAGARQRLQLVLPGARAAAGNFDLCLQSAGEFFFVKVCEATAPLQTRWQTHVETATVRYRDGAHWIGAPVAR